MVPSATIFSDFHLLCLFDYIHRIPKEEEMKALRAAFRSKDNVRQLTDLLTQLGLTENSVPYYPNVRIAHFEE